MKNRLVILGCLVSVVFLLIGYGYGDATVGQAEVGSCDIGIISVRKIFQDCKRGARYSEQASAEQQRLKAELEKMSKEVEAGEAGLKALKPGSSDYITQMKELLEKRANYRAKQELYGQQMELTDQMWTKELYQDILRIVGEVAKEKGLKLVLREEEIDFSETNITELGLTMRTHKVIYSGGCVDITGEITARLDAQENR